jgi:hypothetical protein
VEFGPEGSRLFVYRDEMLFLPAAAPPQRLPLRGRCVEVLRRRLIDRDGVLWVGEQGNRGVLRITAEGRIDERAEVFAPPDIMTLLEGPDGAIWIGTYHQGLAVFRDGPVRQRWLNYPSPDNGVVTALFPAHDGRIWGVGTYGLSEHDALGRTLQHIPLPARSGSHDQFFTAGAFDGAGRVWAFASAKLWIVEGGRFVHAPVQPLESSAAHGLVRDRDGALWLLGDRSLERIEGGRIEKVASLAAPARALLIADDGTRWLAADALYIVEPDATGFRLREVLRPDSSGTVLSNLAQFDGGLWITTHGEGIWRLPLGARDGKAGDVRASVRRWGRNEGLPSDHYYALAFGWPEGRPQETTLWLVPATNAPADPQPLISLPRDALRLDGPQPNLARTWRRYAREQGVIGAPLAMPYFPSTLTAQDGRVWFAGIEGLALVDTAKRLPDAVPPPVPLAARLGTRWQAAPEGVLSLPDAQSPFALELRNPRFDLAGRWAARYRIDDTPWQELFSDLAIRLGSVPPGRHRLEIQGVLDGRSESVPLVFTLDVPLPLWQRPWAIAATALLLTGLLWLLWRIRLRQLQRANRRLNQEVQRRTEQAQQETAARERAEAQLLLNAQEQWLALDGPTRVVAAALCQIEAEPVAADALQQALGDLLAPLTNSHELLRRSLIALQQRGLIEAAPDGWRLKHPQLRTLSQTRTELAELWRNAYTHIAQYQVLEPLGEGGMGTVFRALDQDAGREVALKRIKLEFSDEDEVHARFLNECNVLRTLDHPNIVRYLDAGRFHHEVYLVMELLSGRTLAQRLLEHGPLPEDDVRHILHDLRTALDALHAAGIVHRDLKPSNFMQTDTGTIKLIDFGLALNLSRDTRLTQTLLGVGTLDYCAPEQLFGARHDQTHHAAATGITPHTDWWSLGVATCELLTGHPPWLQQQNHRTFLASLASPDGPPRGDAYHALPPQWQAFVDSCLATEPAQRRPDWAAALQDAHAASQERL